METYVKFEINQPGSLHNTSFFFLVIFCFPVAGNQSMARSGAPRASGGLKGVVFNCLAEAKPKV